MRRAGAMLVIAGRLSVYLAAIALLHGAGSAPVARLATAEPRLLPLLASLLIGILLLGICLELLSGVARWR
jgi:hypothetical protein